MSTERYIDKIGNEELQARLKRAFRQFWKYCLVGASGYVINMAVFSVLWHYAGMQYWLAATASFAISATNNFLLNKYWTFENPEGQVATQARRFLVVSVLSWAMNMAVLVFLIEALDVHHLFAQAIAISLVTVFNFTGNKLWSFRRHPV